MPSTAKIVSLRFYAASLVAAAYAIAEHLVQMIYRSKVLKSPVPVSIRLRLPVIFKSPKLVHICPVQTQNKPARAGNNDIRLFYKHFKV